MPFSFSLVHQVSNKISREGCGTCLEHRAASYNYSGITVFFFFRICVITLAEAHPLLQSGKTIKNINYQISANCSRLQNKVSGKSKRVWLFGFLSFYFNHLPAWDHSVISWIESQQLTFVFNLKWAPLHLKNLDFLKAFLLVPANVLQCSCSTGGFQCFSKPNSLLVIFW